VSTLYDSISELVAQQFSLLCRQESIELGDIRARSEEPRAAITTLSDTLRRDLALGDNSGSTLLAPRSALQESGA